MAEIKGINRSQKPLVVQEATEDESSNLLELKNKVGTTVFSVDKLGAGLGVAKPERLTTALYDDFQRANGHPGTSLSGHAWLTSGAQLPVISGGQLVTSADGSGYAMLDNVVTPYMMDCQYVMTGTGGGGGGTLIISIDAGIGLSNMLHLIFQDLSWTLQKRVAGGSFDGVLSHTYETPLVMDNTTKYQMSMSVTDSTVTVTGSDGISKSYTHADVATVKGPSCIWQPGRSIPGGKEVRFVTVQTVNRNTTEPRQTYATQNDIGRAIGPFIDNNNRLIAHKGSATLEASLGVQVEGFPGIKLGPYTNTHFYAPANNDVRTPATSFAVAYGAAGQMVIGGNIIYFGSDYATSLQRNGVSVLATNGCIQIFNNVVGNVALLVRAVASQTADLHQWQNSGGGLLARVDKNGTYITNRNAAPADGDLVANEMALWFDPTNGAAKLMVKAKQADGTVRTGNIALI